MMMGSAPRTFFLSVIGVPTAINEQHHPAAANHIQLLSVAKKPCDLQPISAGTIAKTVKKIEKYKR